MMSLSYYIRKGLVYVSNTTHAGIALSSLGAAIGIGTAAGWAVTPPAAPSAERTPVSGDVQATLLDKSLSVLDAMAGDLRAKEDTFETARQVWVLNPATGAAYEKAQQEYETLRTAFSKADVNFSTALLLSEGISETDALKYIGNYKEIAGAAPLEEPVAAYLDECQAGSHAPPSENPEITAIGIRTCANNAYAKAGGRQNIGMGIGGVGGLIGGFFLFLYGNDIFGRKLAEEEEKRRRKKEQRRSDAEKKIKAREINLKIKIARPE